MTTSTGSMRGMTGMAEMSNHIGRNLSYYREAAGLSTVELAEKVGWCVTDILCAEAGYETCALFRGELAKALDITSAELTRNEPTPPKPMGVTDPGEGRRGLEDWKRLG